MTGQMPNAGKGKMPPSPSVSEWDVLGSPTLSQTPSVSPKGKRGQSEVENETDITKTDVVKDSEKEQALLTKVAILQRELDSLKQNAWIPTSKKVH